MDRKRRINHKAEEEEYMNRRSSCRNIKRVKYIQWYDNDEEEEEEEEEEDQEDNEQSGSSNQNTNYQRAQENELWPVTCGNKKGTLHVGKLERGEECIECECRWFAPGAFEDFGGRASSKKWKQSISYKNRPLQFWIEKGVLGCKAFKRRGTGTIKSQQKKILPHRRILESSSEESEIRSEEETEGDDDDDDDDDDDVEDEDEDEKVGAETIDSEVDQTKEEEDEMEKGTR
ncbi:nuclear body protein SP140-like protein [Centropristis striata]|uniref:nuclear body protein SP140-like protein n=1 Tax=Centropristis striata TaxID=184440 RepID=UPI0027DEB184|nr:nuclear body protein SP140-like protein [Centropristis striata]